MSSMAHLRSRSLWAGLALLAAVVLAFAAASPGPSAPQTQKGAKLSSAAAVARLRSDPHVHSWLARYRHVRFSVHAQGSLWLVEAFAASQRVASGAYGRAHGQKLYARIGPEIDFELIRGGSWPSGPKLGRPLVWLGLALAFLLAVMDLRRLRSLRNLDAVMLLSPIVSYFLLAHRHWISAELCVYPPLLYLVLRLGVLGLRRRNGKHDPRNDAETRTKKAAAPGRLPLPRALLVCALVLLLLLRAELTWQGRAFDIGYAGAQGAALVVHGKRPYGNFADERCYRAKGIAPPDYTAPSLSRKARACEIQPVHGDTYGPVMYLAYLPAYALYGDASVDAERHAALLTSFLFDLLCLLGLYLAGRRYGGKDGGLRLALAFAAYPFTTLTLSMAANDAVPATLLLFAFLARRPLLRGALLALSGWSKLASLALLPLWLARARRRLLFLLGVLLATALALAVTLLDGPGGSLQGLHQLLDDTLLVQTGRHSPLSIWDWGHWHAQGLPDLKPLQRALEALLLVVALALALPRRRSPLRLAALSAALLFAFQLVLTHWFYTYLEWGLPLALVALFAVGSGPERGRGAARRQSEAGNEA